jgi:serine/threonine-protein kinase
VPTDLQVDDIIGQFPEASPLGKGGQKVVFTVQHPQFGHCVLKIGFYSSRQGLKRIQREVAILRDLSSPYFPRHFSFTLLEPDRYFILEEFLEGPTLQAAFADFIREQAACTLGRHLTAALSLLWERRIVHRDLKPQNVIISPDHPKIIDLGIARLLDAESLTYTYAPSGPCTPNYASPEQLENRKRDIDLRTDQFALGILLAQAVLGGMHPFSPDIVGGDSITDNILASRWAREAVCKATSPPMSATISRLLGREPYMRFRTAAALFTALNGLARAQQ